MSPQATEVSLLSLGNGTAMELFSHELKKVMANIKDPNTDGKKKRSITLKVEFVPFSDRTGFQAVIDVKTSLAAVPAVPAGNIFIMRDGGELKAYSHDTRQEQLFQEEEKEEQSAASNVVPLTKQA